MNACFEFCGLGHFRGGTRSENPETSRLLYGDPYRPQYGTQPQNGQRVIHKQPNPEVLRREREEMEGICHRMSDQVIDVFNVAPQESNRALTRDQTLAKLKRNGVDTSNLNDMQIDSFAKQPLAVQQKSIHIYHGSERRNTNSQQEEKGESYDGEAHSDVHTKKGNATRDQWSPSDEELIYKTVKRTRRDPVSIELDQNESKAAKAAMG